GPRRPMLSAMPPSRRCRNFRSGFRYASSSLAYRVRAGLRYASFLKAVGTQVGVLYWQTEASYFSRIVGGRSTGKSDDAATARATGIAERSEQIGSKW